MSAHCMPTGARPGFGNRVSHSRRRTSRRYWPPGEGRYARLRLTTRGIKTVDTVGVEAAVV
ncbi:bL28 family ribosomal protein [Streptomyces sp. NPDC088350]|uniref:large ribosomal subunit protein bL28 n=1 Tax=Streptomyces sp. NPDC088350 TaxID=3365854 RepID=UPI00380A85C0